MANTKQSKSVCCETSRAWPKLSELELSSRANAGESSDVLLAVGELTSTLNTVVKRLESTSSTSDSARLKAVLKVVVIVHVLKLIALCNCTNGYGMI